MKTYAIGLACAGPNAFILTPARVRSYMQVADHCAQAIALAQNAAKAK